MYLQYTVTPVDKSGGNLRTLNPCATGSQTSRNVEYYQHPARRCTIFKIPIGYFQPKNRYPSNVGSDDFDNLSTDHHSRTPIGCSPQAEAAIKNRAGWAARFLVSNPRCLARCSELSQILHDRRAHCLLPPVPGVGDDFADVIQIHAHQQ